MPRIPYEIAPRGGLQATGGVTTCFTISFPSRAVIDKIVIIQTGGVVANFVAALFNHAGACQGHDESESLAGEAALLPHDLYRVTPDLAGGSGSLAYFANDPAFGTGRGYPFFNQDGPGPVGAQLGNQRNLYLRITPQGAGPKEFAVVIGGEVCM